MQGGWCEDGGRVVDLTSLRQHELVPEIPVANREENQASHRNLRKTKRFSPQREMRPFSRAMSLEKLHVLS